MNQSNSCTQSQQLLGTESKLMRIAPESIMLGFSNTKTFILCSMPPIPVILRGAEGEVAESILSESTFSLGVLIEFKDPSPSAREVSVQLKEPFMGEGGILAVSHGEDTIKGIFPKTPEKM